MKTLLKLGLSALVLPVLAFCISSTSIAQNRTVGANKLMLDDGLGHTVTLQTATPATTGVLTLPSGGANLANTANGTVTGQMTRWNNATSQWEVSPSVTNAGSTLSNAGAISATGGSGNITASGTLSASGNVSSTSGNVTAAGNVTASGNLQPGAALGTGTPVNGGVYTDNMIQAAGFAGLDGTLVSQVGNFTITHNGTGIYTITFPYNVSQYPIVMIQAGTNPISEFVTSLSPLTISVYEFFPGAVTPVDGGFNFIVVGPHS
jgi:hypothetical protein